MIFPSLLHPRKIFIATTLAIWFFPLTVAADAFCCADATGKKFCGDSLPSACYNRAYIKYGQGGAKQIDAPLTPDQQAIKDEQLRLQRNQERQERESKLLDRALLLRYPTIASLDDSEVRELSSYQTELEELTKSMETMKARGQQLNETPDKKKTEAINSEIKLLQATMDNQQKIIDSKIKDINNIKTRYAADRKRLQDILSAEDRIAPPVNR